MGATRRYSALFLDRDGVINVQREDDYVKSKDEFVFAEGALEALRMVSPHFKYAMIMTNQRGVGKGVVTMPDLTVLHEYMLREIAAAGGRIDRIYVCPAVDDAHADRKPNTGMAVRAKNDFPDVDFSKSFFVGDSLSDVLFANNAGIPAVLVGNKYTREERAAMKIRAHYPDLITFARQIDSRTNPSA